MLRVLGTVFQKQQGQAQSYLQRQCWKSTVASSTSTKNDAETSSVETTTTTTNNVELVQVPSLPLVGSLLQAHSKIPHAFEQHSIFDFWLGMSSKYGAFYEFGLPGVGWGLHGTCYVIQDPHEMASILRDEGQYPFGSAEFVWATSQFFQDRGVAAGGIVQHGKPWKKIRRFVQTDLLSPKSAARYVPGILQGAASASKGAQAHAEQKNLNHYLNLASFDLFSNIMLGTLPNVSDPSSPSHPHEEEFCRAVATALRMSALLMSSPKDAILKKNFGYKTKAYRTFEDNWARSQDIAYDKIDDLYQRMQQGDITTSESNSYGHQAFVRQASEDNQQAEQPVTLQETKEIVGGLLSAGVDTTGGMLSWKLLHLASSPEAQDKIYHELQPTLVNGKLTRESLVLPYLNACIRESHRLANPNVPIPMKLLPKERPVHGHVLPKDSVIILDGYSTGMQQEHFTDPVQDFHPERFLSRAVEERKGTSSQVVDHSFFRGPFSQGARKCPGSRVANLEAVALCAQWVLDYQMELPSDIHHWSEVPYGLETVTTAKLPQIQFTPRAH